MKTSTKIFLGAGSMFLGSLIVYSGKELIKEYNRTLQENDELREYIAKKLVKSNQNCDIVLSNGKRFTNERVEKSVVPQIIKTYEENEQEITVFDNGWRMVSYKGGA